MYFHKTPFIIPLVFNKYLWHNSREKKKIYLTFDDGPVPGVTEFVLTQLEKFEAKATFFCVGDNIRKHPEVFQQILVKGHKVGNHTYNHLNGRKNPEDKYLQNVEECEKWIGNHSQKLFRPPYGRMTRFESQELLKKYTIVMWDVLTADFSKKLSAEKCLSNSIKATRNGSIVLFHDSYKAEKNMTYALPRFLEHFSAQGFTFESL